MTQTTEPDPYDVDFALWGTQGGGLARANETGELVWHVVPADLADAKVGDLVHEQWGSIPANDLAVKEMQDEEYSS